MSAILVVITQILQTKQKQNVVTEKLTNGNKVIVSSDWSDNMVILIDTRIKKFVEGCLLGENDETISIRLKDIDETFWFENEVAAQEFLTKQVTERVADKELRKGYFDYIDEYGDTHRYFINDVTRGKILSFTEEIVK